MKILTLLLLVFFPSINYVGNKIRVYELGASISNDNDLTLKNCLILKNADIDKYGYSGYGIEFDRRGSFSFPVVELVKMY